MSSPDMPPYSCLDATLHRNQVTTEFWRDTEQVSVLTNAIFVLGFFLIGLPSNMLIIVSVVRLKLYREPTHFLLLNLAISDLLLCVLVMPFTITAGFAGECIFGNSDYTRCKVCQASVILSALTLFSLHILSVISVDRFLFIKFPLRYDNYVTVRRMTVVVILTWVLASLLSIPPLFGLGDMDYTRSISTCTPRFQYRTNLTRNIYYMMMLILESLLPIAVLFVSNVWVICIAQKHLLVIYRANKASTSKHVWTLCREGVLEKLSVVHRKQVRLVCVFIVIVTANAINWIPLIIRSLLSLLYGYDNLTAGSAVFVYLCFISHSVIHPLIEAGLIPEIRNYCLSLAHIPFSLCIRAIHHASTEQVTSVTHV